MKRKSLLFLLLFALLAPWAANAQETLTVHELATQSTSSNVPIWGLWADNDLQCEMVYPATELSDMAGGTISVLTYYTSGTSNITSWNGTCQVFMKEVDATTITEFTGTTGATTVYNGSVSVQSGVMTIELSTSYTYGGGNLLVGFYYTTGGSYASASWVGETVSGASIYGRSGQSYSVNNANFLPKTTFTYEPASTGCDMPTSIAVSNVTADGATVTWEGDGDAWNLRYKASTDTDFTMVNGLTTKTYTFTGLNNNTTYSVGVQTVCTGSTSNFKSTSFTTDNPCLAPTDLVTSNITDVSATLSWTAGYPTQSSWIVNYKKSADAWDDAETETVTSPTVTLSNLEENTTYNVRIYACADGAYLSGSFTTKYACAAPTNFAASNLTATSATISWTAGFQETAWTLKYKKSADAWDDATEVSVSGTPTTELTGLDEFTTYNVRVFNCTGESDPYLSGSFTTLEVCPDGKICIGQGNSTNTSLPANNYYNYSLTQQIYTAAEIGEAGAILSIDFFKASTTAMAVDLDIYMVSTTKDEFASLTDFVPVTSSDLVFSGTVTFADNAWTTIELDAPFIYDGTSNVAIMVDNNTGDYESSTPFYVFSSDKNQALYAQSDNTNFDPFAPAFSYKTAQKNRVRLVVGEPPACPKPTGLAVDYQGGTEATISWNSEATAWNMKVNGTPINGTITNPYTLTGLELATTYEVEVQANCGNATSDWAGPVSFTTDPCLPENQCELTFVLTDTYGDSWNGNAIKVTDVATGIVVATLANQNLDGVNGEETQTVTLAVCDGRALEFSWVAGSYPGETQYTVTDINNEVVLEGSGAFETFNYTVSCTVTSCRKPTDLAVSEVGSRSATLTWVENGEAEAWEVEVTDLDGGQITTWNATRTNYELTGLTPATNYSVRVNPVCDVDKWSDPLTFTTDVACPAPTALNVNPLTPISATLNWTGNASGYNVQYRPVVPGEVLVSSDFEDSELGRWTNIDADGDGYIWEIFTTATSYLGENGGTAGYGHDGSQDFVTSGSYTNVDIDGDGYGDVLYPDNYLVSPQVELGGRITFWACGQDASYPAEHFGVAVSTTGNTNAADFTTIKEWTMTAKSVGTTMNHGMTRSGNRAQGNWYQFSADLSAYAGQTGYVAIRHFNCSDKFLLDVDDIVIEGPVNNPWTEATVSENLLAITGLSEATEYEWQVQAVCGGEDGESTWASSTFTTPTACDAPTDLETTNLMPTSATLSWTGYQTSYNLNYREVAVSWQQVDIDKTATGEWTEYSFDLSDFAGQSGYVAIRHYNVSDQFMLDVDDITYNGTTYNFDDGALPTGWATYDLDGDGYNWVLGSACGGVYLAEGASLSGTGYNDSDDLLVSGSYSNVTGAALTPDNWLILPYGNLGGTLSFYAKGQDASYAAEVFGVYVYVGEEYSFENNNPWITIEGVTNPYDLTGLSDATGYEWQVQGVNANCTDGVEWSEIATFHTPGACDGLTSAAIDEVTATSMTMSWTGYQESYLVQYRTAAKLVDVTFEDAAAEQGNWTTDNLETCAGDDPEDPMDPEDCMASGWDLIPGYFTFIFTENPPQTLISPEVTVASNSTLAFDYAVYRSSYPESFKVGFSTTDNNVGSFTWGEEVTVNNVYFETYFVDVPDGAKYFAIQCTSEDQYALILDDFAIGQYVPAGEWQNEIVEGNTVTINGLTPETTYDLMLQGICGEDEYTNAVTGSFTTLEQTNLTQTLQLTAGKNWVSFYVETNMTDLRAALVEAVGTTGIQIVSQSGGLCTYTGRIWTGQLKNLDLALMYRIIVPIDCEITLEAMPIDPASLTLNIAPGKNWIGFPFSESMSVTDFFAGFAIRNDAVKSQSDGQCTYTGRLWTGQLKNLAPGKGYIYTSSAETTKPFTYPTTSKAYNNDKASILPLLNKKTAKSQLLKKDCKSKYIIRK